MKKILIKESQFKKLINDEFLGALTYWKTNQEYEVFKNPPSISRMASELRAVADPNGNLFVLDEPGIRIIHQYLMSWLVKNGHISDNISDFYDTNVMEKYVLLQRYHSTNIFYLSESYNFDDEYYDILRIQRTLENTKKKNPKYIFIIKSIDSASDSDLENDDVRI